MSISFRPPPATPNLSELSASKLAAVKEKLAEMLASRPPWHIDIETLGQPDSTKWLYCDVCAEIERRELGELLDSLVADVGGANAEEGGRK